MKPERPAIPAGTSPGGDDADLKRCLSCRAVGYPDDIYCPRCGALFGPICGRCGAPVVHPVAVYCVRCGAKLNTGPIPPARP